MTEIVLYAESPGDPGVGISSEYAEVHMCFVDDDEREFVREVLQAAFLEIWGGGTRVRFKEELDAEDYYG